jgi:hypothetical protein
MRAQDFINEEKIATYYIGGLVVDVDKHTVFRRQERGVNDAKIYQAIRKLIYIEKKIRKIQGGHKFWVDDPATGISLGMRRSSTDPDKIYFNTVVAKRTYDGPGPVIELPAMQFTEEQLDELSFLGSECTKDCSGHRAGYEWSSRKGNIQGNSPYSPSFNKGANLRAAGK